MPLTGHHFQQEWRRALNWYDSSAVHRTKPPTGTGGEQTCSAEIQTGTVAIQVRTAGIQPRSFAVPARVATIPACEATIRACEPTIRVRRATVRVCSATVRSPASCGRGWSVSRNPGASSKATPAPATPPPDPSDLISEKTPQINDANDVAAQKCPSNQGWNRLKPATNRLKRPTFRLISRGNESIPRQNESVSSRCQSIPLRSQSIPRRCQSVPSRSPSISGGNQPRFPRCESTWPTDASAGPQCVSASQTDRSELC